MKTEWISVKDKLPPIGITVLVYPYYGSFRPDHVGAMVVYNDGKGGAKFEYHHDQITHWARMMKPPVTKFLTPSFRLSRREQTKGK